MSDRIGRRELIGAAGTALAVGAMGVEASGQETPGVRQETPGPRRIVGICCSPRKGKTTAAGLRICLEAAEAQGAGWETELIELADLSIPACLAAGVPLKPGEKDDFPGLVDKLGAPDVGGIIVGSPVHFGNMSALCKSFLDRCIVFRKDGFKLRNKVAGVLAVGSARNGGQELTVRSIQTALTGQDMVFVGSGRPSARIGATLWNQGDSIAEDEFGSDTAKSLGRRVAELAGMIR